MTLSTLRATVIERDKGCVAAKLDRSHTCRDQWSQRHDPTDLKRLTLEHVREHPGGMRRDEKGWCLALCWAANDAHWSSANIVAAHAWLAAMRQRDAA